MAIVLDLKPEVEQELSAKAQERGITVQELVASVLTTYTSAQKNLFDLGKGVRGLLTDAEVDEAFRRRGESRPVQFP